MVSLPRPRRGRPCAVLSLASLALTLLIGLQAQAKECKKGRKPCGDKCISAKKVCKEEGAAPVTPSTPADSETKTLSSASDAAVAAALQSQAGKAMLELARGLRKSGDLDVGDKERDAFKQALRGVKQPVVICGISHVQLVRDCEPLVGGTVALPCYLAVDELSDICKAIGSPMPQMK